MIWGDSEILVKFDGITEEEIEAAVDDPIWWEEASWAALTDEYPKKIPVNKKHQIIPIFDTKIIVLPILSYFWVKKKFLMSKFKKA